MFKSIFQKAIGISSKKPSSQINDPDHDFSLNSGERQTGKTLADIRHDHRARYDFSINYLKENFLNNQSCFGLDIFCGTGYGTYMQSSSLDCPILGIDGSCDAVTFANTYFKNKKTLYAHKVFPFTLPAETFNFISCYESLEHIKDASLFIKQIATSLKQDGYLFLSVPNERCWPHTKTLNPFHVRHYSMQGVKVLISEMAGLELKMWLGQNLYEHCDTKSVKPLSEDKMGLVKSQEGQVLIYVFKKR